MLLISGCLQTPLPSLNFTTAPGDQGLDEYSEPQAAVTGQKWIDRKMFYIKEDVKTWCAGGRITGNFTIDRNNLNLLYSVIPNAPVPSYLCSHNVTNTLTNLEYRNYKISLKGG